MKKIAVIMSAIMFSLSLSGCSSLSTTHTDKYGDTYVKGVAYYDRNGELQKPVPEAISPKNQDRLETAGWIGIGAAALGGLSTGIVALTK